MSEITDLINAAVNRAATQQSNAIAALNVAFNYLAHNQYQPDKPSVSVAPPSYDIQSPPVPVIKQFNPVDPPTMGELIAASFFDLPATPDDNTGAAPTFSLPSSPAQLGDFTAQAPSVDIPSAPPTIDFLTLLEGIRAPDELALSLPARPSVNLPEFSATNPGASPSAPTNLSTSLRAAYDDINPVMVAQIKTQADAKFAELFPLHASGVSALETRLSTYLAGGIGVDDETADNIQELARAQVEAEGRRVYRNAYAEAGKRGFTIPPGSTLAAVRKGQTDTQRAVAGLAADLRKTRFEYGFKALQFGVEQARQWRGMAVEFYSRHTANLVQLNGQAIDYAREVVRAIVETFNAVVKAYEAALEGYKTEASVYRMRLDAALSVIEVYKAEIQAELAKVEINRERVALYEAKLHAVEIYANVQRAQVELVVAFANLQKLKVDIFEAQTRAFAAQAQGKEAEYRGYVAQIEGQTAQVKAYEAKVQGLVAKYQGYGELVRGMSARSQAQITYNESVTRQYEAATRAFGTLTEAQLGEIRAQVETFRAQSEAANVQNRALEGKALVYQKSYELAQNLALKERELAITQARNSADVSVANMNAVAQLATAAAGFFSRMAEASFAGINTLAAETTTI